MSYLPYLVVALILWGIMAERYLYKVEKALEAQGLIGSRYHWRLMRRAIFWFVPSRWYFRKEYKYLDQIKPWQLPKL